MAAVERNITADDKFFLGTDQRIVGIVYQADGITVEDISGLTELIFVLAPINAKTKLPTGIPTDALIIKKLSEAQIEILTDGTDGAYVIIFDDTDTDGSADSLKAAVEYAYCVKRFDPDEVLTFGTFAFLASTQRREA